MLIVTTTLIRPSADIPFYNAGAEWAEYFRSTYTATGKCAVPEVSFSQDLLTTTRVSRWRSVADNEEYLIDATADAMKTARTAYSTEHGIQVLLTSEVVFDEFDQLENTNP
jgi:hypothetical protein